MQASLLGEGITGKGILSQLNLETGIPIYEAEPLLLFFILFTLLGAIGALGDRGKFVDDPPTGLEKAVIPPGKSIRSALGLKEGGNLPLYNTYISTTFTQETSCLNVDFGIDRKVFWSNNLFGNGLKCKVRYLDSQSRTSCL